MRAYKATNKDMTCTMGKKGRFQYELGKTVTEEEANCARNGLHACSNPLDCLGYYGNMKESRYFLAEAGGDIHEDACATRLSCTELTLLKELSTWEFVLEACKYIALHPELPENNRVKRTAGRAEKGDPFVIVRGKHPKAAGCPGAILALLREEPGTHKIIGLGLHVVGQAGIRPGRYYNLLGKEVRRNDDKKGAARASRH